MIDYDTIRVMGDVNVDFSIRQINPTDSYILRNADGITAPKFNMKIQETLYQGGVFQNRQPISRQVTLEVLIQPDYSAGETVSSLRQALYRMLSPRWQRPVKVQLMLAGTVVAEVEGHLSDLPMNPFTKEPLVQIVIDCLSAYLTSPSITNYLPETPGVLTIDYPGTAPTGFSMSLIFTQDVEFFEISHLDNVNEKIRLENVYIGEVSSLPGSGGTTETDGGGAEILDEVLGIKAGDTLTINTRPGLRSVTLTRGGISYSILSAYTDDSKWIELYEGSNDFMISTDKFTWSNVSFLPQWWGA